MSSPHWYPAYIGVGSNLEQPDLQVDSGIKRIGAIAHTRVIARSPFYRSLAWGRADQPDFINAVVGVLTHLSSSDLLAALLELEIAAGRPPRREKWAPRVLDLDLLLFGTEQSAAPERLLPHPGIAGRNFVLFPLCDLAPHLDIPGVGRVSQLAARLSSENIQVLP
jgi:2-amino-4-hydroxy-6-hydroxymethyldihydropteridine diphosphokinase